MLVHGRPPVQGDGRETTPAGTATPERRGHARSTPAAAPAAVADACHTAALAAAPATRAARRAAAASCAARGGGGAAGERAVPAAAQADRAVLPGERRAC